METKKLPTLETNLQAECTYIPAKQREFSTAKSFLDCLLTAELSGDRKIGEVEFCFFVDESGSMSSDCGGQTRKQAAHSAIQAILADLPTGLLVSMTAFATDHCVVIPRRTVTNESRQKLILDVVNAHRGEVGSGTAIHANVQAKMERLRDSAFESKGIKATLIVVMTDGQDNSGAMPWTDHAATSGEMQTGLEKLAELAQEIQVKRRCAVQLAFAAVSKEACWNVIRALNQAKGLNTMGGVVNQDGLYLTELLQFFTNRFLKTAYLQTILQIQTVPPLPCRILDAERQPRETKAGESYGANYIQTPWASGKTQRHLGTLVSGQNLGMVIQVRWPLNADASLTLPEESKEVTITATLTGYQQPVNAGDEYVTGTITQTHLTIPISEVATQFDQSSHKFRLRLSKQKTNMMAHVNTVYTYLNNETHFGGYGARQISRLLPDQAPQLKALVDGFNLLITDIQKDCRQEMEDRLRRKHPVAKAEELIAKRGKRLLEDPFYRLKPVLMATEATHEEKFGYTAGYNILIEEARILQFYLTHPYFQDEAAAKALAFINPQRAIELVRPTFNGLPLMAHQSKALYEGFFKESKAELEWQQEWQKLYLGDLAEFKKIEDIPPRVYPRCVLVGIAETFVRTGLSPEVLAQIKSVALLNDAKSAYRYINRIPSRN
jgi:hypothetical protein